MKNMNLLRACSVVILSVLFTGCGTISTMKTPAGGDPVSLSRFNTVCVLDFDNCVSSSRTDHRLGALFADKIADEIERKDLFEKVSRTPVQEDSLVIGGRITRCTDGNVGLRFWIGMGAGSSYFDADVKFRDGLSKQDIAVMTVDKNSWVLGGAIAASQTVEVFMNDAARKIAQQLERAQ